MTKINDVERYIHAAGDLKKEHFLEIAFQQTEWAAKLLIESVTETDIVTSEQLNCLAKIIDLFSGYKINKVYTFIDDFLREVDRKYANRADNPYYEKSMMEFIQKANAYKKNGCYEQALFYYLISGFINDKANKAMRTSIDNYIIEIFEKISTTAARRDLNLKLLKYSIPSAHLKAGLSQLGIDCEIKLQHNFFVRATKPEGMKPTNKPKGP